MLPLTTRRSYIKFYGTIFLRSVTDLHLLAVLVAEEGGSLAEDVVVDDLRVGGEVVGLLRGAHHCGGDAFDGLLHLNYLLKIKSLRRSMKHAEPPRRPKSSYDPRFIEILEENSMTILKKEVKRVSSLHLSARHRDPSAPCRPFTASTRLRRSAKGCQD